MLVGVVLVASATSVGASHGDGTYDLPVWFRWDRSALHVIIVPPNHGQILNGNGALNGGDPNEVTPFNSYLKAIEASIADWDKAVEMFGADWLRLGLVTNVYVAGRDAIPTSALTNPEILVTTDETKGVILGVAVSTRPCLVNNSKFFVQSFSYEDMYNVNSQEYGHCLGLEHVVDNHPEHDAMAGQYVDPVGAKGGHLHCVSNLDVVGLHAVFGRLFGQPSPNSVSISTTAYGTTCAPPAAPGESTPTPQPSDATVGPAPSPSPSSSASPSPEPSPSPSSSASPSPDPSPSPTVGQPPVNTRSVSLRLRGHLSARGRVETAAGAEHCYQGVRVGIQRRAPEGWSRVATRSAGRDGSFRITVPDRKGRYRAVVARMASDKGTCARAVSPRRTHTH